MQELIVCGPQEITLKEMGDFPDLGKDEVRIRLIFGGICGSDLSVYKGKLPHAVYPVRPGHELLGRIVEAGERVMYPLGTRVIVQPNSYCGVCEFCVQGKSNICPQKKSLGINTNGGFSEQFTISSKYIMPVPDELPDERAILTEPFAVVVHGIKKLQIGKGTRVAVIGCGNEGMLAAALADYLGANVTGLDINPVKAQFIRSIGHIRFLHVEEAPKEAYDVVIEAAGVASTFEKGLQLVRPGGQMLLFGLAPEASIPLIRVVRNEITLFGSIIYNVPEDFQQAMRLLGDPRLNVEPIVSEILPFTEYRQAYRDALSGSYGKIVLDFRSAENRLP